MALPYKFQDVSFTIGRTYFFLICLAFALAVRAIVLAFIAATKIKDDPVRCEHCKREIPECPECHRPRESRKGRYWREYKIAYLYCWYGLSARDRRHYDLWLPFIIGVAELMAYPILMAFGEFRILGGWVAIRTAGAWGAWKSERTAFYRYLLGVVLNVAIAYVFLVKYICVP